MIPLLRTEGIAAMLFYTRGHRHPQGRIPRWGDQPDMVRKSFLKGARVALSSVRNQDRILEQMEP